MKNLKCHIINRLLFYASLTSVVANAVFCLFLCGCETEDDSDRVVVVSATPSSVVPGEHITVELTSLEPVFTDKKVTPVASDGNMILGELLVQDEKHALVSVGAAQLTDPGLHTFELDFGDRIALLKISAVNPPQGPGTARIDKGHATAGAKYAKFSIWGNDTHFDSDVEVSIENAEGMKVILADVKTETWIEVSYEIDVTQKPTTATVVLIDGQDRYDFPFEIVQPVNYTNEVTNQALVRGQFGVVSLRGEGATLYAGTHPVGIPDNIEYAATVSTSQGAELNMRVPADYSADALKFDCYTYTEDGTALEIFTTEILIIDPVFAVPVPSVISADSGEMLTSLLTNAAPMQTITAFEIAPVEGIVNMDWEPDGSMSWLLSSSAESASYPFTVTFENNYQKQSQIVIENDDTPLLHVAKSSFHLGDHDYLQIALSTNNLIRDAVSLELDNCIEVLETIYVDSGTVIFSVSICEDTNVLEYGSSKLLMLHNGNDSYQLNITLFDVSLVHTGLSS